MDLEEYLTIAVIDSIVTEVKYASFLFQEEEQKQNIKDLLTDLAWYKKELKKECAEV